MLVANSKIDESFELDLTITVLTLIQPLPAAIQSRPKQFFFSPFLHWHPACSGTSAIIQITAI